MIDEADEGRTIPFNWMDWMELGPECVTAMSRIHVGIEYRAEEARLRMEADLLHIQRCLSQGLRRVRERALRSTSGCK